MKQEHDEIEFFREGKSLYKTCLPEGSDGKLRIAIAEHAKIGWYDRFTIISPNGVIRVDSDNTDVLKKEMDITNYMIFSRSRKEEDRYKTFWGKLFRDDKNILYVKDIKTGEKYDLDQVVINDKYYDETGN